MMGPVVYVGEIYLGSSSCPSFLVFLDVHDHYRLGHPAVLQEEVLAECRDPRKIFSSFASDDGPFLEG